MKSKFAIIVSFLLSLVYTAIAQSPGDYRTRQSGAWHAATSWQMYNGSSWVNATAIPSYANGTITILSGHTITSGVVDTADQVVINSGGTLSINDGTFTVADGTGTDLDCSGILALSNNGTLTGAGTLTLNTGSTFNWSGGYNAGGGTLNINAGATLNQNSGTVYLADTKTINNYGTWNWTGNSTFYYYSGSPIINNYGTFNISADGDVYHYNGTSGSFNNKPAGIINKTGTAPDDTYFDNTFSNAGTININSGKLRFIAGSVHSGTINIAVAANMTLYYGSSFFNAGTVIAGSGTLNFEGGSDTINAASLAVNNINMSAGVVVYVGPAITLGSGSTMTMSNSTLTGPGSVTFNTGSTFNWSGGYMAGAGVLNINAGASFNLDGSTAYLEGTRMINNYGTWNWTSGPINCYSGAPVINNYGTFNISTDDDMYQYTGGTGSFNNKSTGMINKIGSPLNETSVKYLFTNAGTININSSTLRIDANSVHNGSVNIAFGATMALSTGASSFNTGTSISGDGTLSFEGGTDTISAASIAVGNFNIGGGTVYVSPAVAMGSGGTMNLYGGTLTGPGTITCNAGSTFNWSGGYNAGSGVMNINAGATLNMNPASSDYAYLADTRTINNYGTWNWTGSSTFYYYSGSPVINNYGSFNISTDAGIYQSNSSVSGTFNNKPGGIINKIGSSSAQTSFNINSFSNEGTINIISSKLSLNTNSVHSGKVNVPFGTSLIFPGGASYFNTGTQISGEGTLSFEGGTDTINAGSVSVSTFNVAGATVYVAPAITLGNGNTLSLSSGTLTGPGTITFNTGSTFNWSGGYTAGSGIININAGAVSNVSGYTYLADTRTINNYSTWNWTGSSTFYYNNGSPVVNNYGNFNISTDGGIYGINSSTGIFNNRPTGIINKTGSYSSDTYINGLSSFNNAGAVNINSGNLNLNAGGTHTGAYKIAFGSQLKGSASMVFTGSLFTNEGGVTLTGLSFSGTAAQTLSGEGSINSLTINNTNGLLLGGTQTINNALTLTSGKITLGDNSLILGTSATLTGGNATNYVVTGGQGSLQRNVPGNTNVLFPVGFATTYLPVTIQLTPASTSDNFSVRLLPNIYGSYDTTNGNTISTPINTNSVNTSWFISEGTPGGSSASIVFQWNGANEASGFNRAVSRFGQYKAGTWTLDAGTMAAAGASPYTLTRSGLTSFSVFGITNQFVTTTNNYTTFCSNSTVSIPYTAVGTFGAGNVFTAQLSDSTGSYAAPVTLGSVASTASGSINATIPASTLTATGYRIRIVSSSPSLVSPDNPSIIPIRSCTTTPPVLAKNVPPKINISGITATGALVSWSSVPAATAYEVQYKPASVAAWNTAHVTMENLSMNLLEPGTPYDVRVRSQSGTDYSDFSAAQHFITLDVSANAAAARLPDGRLSVYPNPTTGRFVLALRVKQVRAGSAWMQIINTAGQVVHTESIPVSDYELKKTVSFKPSNSSNAVYFITVRAGNELYNGRIYYQQ